MVELANNSCFHNVFISTNRSFRWLQYMEMAYYVETLQQIMIKTKNYGIHCKRMKYIQYFFEDLKVLRLFLRQ